MRQQGRRVNAGIGRRMRMSCSLAHAAGRNPARVHVLRRRQSAQGEASIKKVKESLLKSAILNE